MKQATMDDLFLNIDQTVEIKAAPGDVFEGLIEHMCNLEGEEGKPPLKLKLERWPGGRWFRDLGNGNGHLWGHVQAIKAPALLEITGPLWMSFAVASNVQYRLKEDNGVTLITLKHSALGLFPDGYRTPAPELGHRIVLFYLTA